MPIERLRKPWAQNGVFGLTTPAGEVVPTAFRPPLYPYLLSWAASDGSLNNLWIAILHSILGGLTAGFTYLASAAWLGPDRGRLRGILAALLVIVDPILIQQSTLVMTETLATALVSIVIWWWMCHLSRSAHDRISGCAGGVAGAGLPLSTHICCVGGHACGLSRAVERTDGGAVASVVSWPLG